MASSPILSRRHFLFLPAGFLTFTTASAQATPEVITDPEISSRMRVAAMLPDLPSAVSAVHLSRYTLDPGSEFQASETPGAALLMLQSGISTLTSDLPVLYRPVGASGPAEATNIPPDGIVLSPGDGALIPDQAGMTLTNDGSDRADLLWLVIVPRTIEASANAPQAAGVTREVLGAGPLPFHTGPAVTIIEQVVVKSGHSAYSTTFKGVEMGVVVSGEATVLCRDGMTWSTPEVLERAALPMPGAIPVEAGALMDLAAGDAYASYDGSLVWQAGPDEPLVVLRTQVIPVPTAR